MKIIQSDEFEDEFKQLQKKYPKILLDVKDFKDELLASKQPIGDRLQKLDQFYVYKARIRNSSANRGKSGGFRLIYYIEINTIVLLISIFSKTEKENMETAQILDILKKSLLKNNL